MEPEVSIVSDHDLVNALKQGIPTAVRDLMSRYGPKLLVAVKNGYGKCPGIKSLHDAEEVVDETFSKIIEKIDTYNSAKASFGTWATEIALNTAIEFGRTHLGWNKKETAPKRIIWKRVEKLWKLAAENNISRDEQRRIMDQMKLKHPRYYDVIEMTLERKFMPHEIAEFLNVDANAVSVWLSRALDWLEREIKREKDES